MELFRVESGPRIARVHRIRRARKVLLVLRDVRQRHARRDVIPEYGQVGARASTARRPAGGTRAHPIEESPKSPVAR